MAPEGIGYPKKGRIKRNVKKILAAFKSGRKTSKMLGTMTEEEKLKFKLKRMKRKASKDTFQ